MVTTLERYERISAFYDLLDLPFEHRRYQRLRPILFEGLSGRILDSGVGTGRNIPFYPPGAEVTGIDISPAMLVGQAPSGGARCSGHVQDDGCDPLGFPRRLL